MSKTVRCRNNKALLLSKRPGYYVTAGNVFSGTEDNLGWGKTSAKVAKEAFSGKNLGGSIGSVTGALTSFADTFKKNSEIADTTGIETGIAETKAEDYVEANDTGSLLDAYNTSIWQNSDYTMKDVRGSSVGEQIGNTFGAVASGASAGASVGGPWGAVAGAALGLGSGLAGLFVGNKKAKEKAEELNRLAEEANKRQQNAFNAQVDSVNQMNFQNRMANLAALGGPLSYADGGGIHIKKKNRGKFTASAKRAGMGVQEYARHILANKERYSPTLVKRANFARNAAGWKHDLGGYLFTHGGDWNNGLSSIDTGGTHEQNPYEGVPMGIAPDGIPNLVEQGEVIFNDYVFSNRLHPSEKELKEANLPKRYKNSTFAYIAEDMGRESSERPNDPISRRGLEDSLGKLATIQEMQRQRKGKKGTQQMMAYGGRKYAGPYDTEVWKFNPDILSWINASINGEMYPILKAAQINKDMLSQTFAAAENNDSQKTTPTETADKSEVQTKETGKVVSQGTSETSQSSSERRTGVPESILNDSYFNALGEQAEREAIQRQNSEEKLISSIVDKPIEDSEWFLPYVNKKGKARRKGIWVKGDEAIEGRRGNNPFEESSETLPTYLRYAPALGSAIGAIQSLFTKPDYSNSDILLNQANNLSRDGVRARTLNNYLTYRPLDRNYYLNQLKGQAGATRRAIMNSGSNAGQVMAGLLAADYNAQNAVGNALMQMDQYNNAQRQQIAQFNRGTDQYNAQALMQADAQNAQIAANRDRLRSSLLGQAAQMREQSDAQLEAMRSGNITNFFDSLGNIGRENMGWNWAKYLADSEVFGPLRDEVPMPGFKRGGMLTKKNRRRR